MSPLKPGPSCVDEDHVLFRGGLHPERVRDHVSVAVRPRSVDGHLTIGIEHTGFAPWSVGQSMLAYWAS